MSSPPQLEQKPKLLHESLEQIPMGMRFGAAGVLGNIIFIVAYNLSVVNFEHLAPASTIYSAVYFFYIPLGHALNSMFVFGWPTGYYVKSLLSNYPIGLTGMAVGTACTAFFDSIGFNEMCEDFLRGYLPFLAPVATDEDEKGKLYSSIVVLMITSVWSYVLSVMVNAPKVDKDGKKEL